MHQGRSYYYLADKTDKERIISILYMWFWDTEQLADLPQALREAWSSAENWIQVSRIPDQDHPFPI